MPSMLPVSSACSDIRRRGEFIEHLLDASALGCASCVRFAPSFKTFKALAEGPESGHSSTCSMRTIHRPMYSSYATAT